MRNGHPQATLTNFLCFADFSSSAGLAVIGDVGSITTLTVIKIPSKGALHEFRS